MGGLFLAHMATLQLSLPLCVASARPLSNPTVPRYPTHREAVSRVRFSGYRAEAALGRLTWLREILTSKSGSCSQLLSRAHLSSPTAVCSLRGLGGDFSIVLSEPNTYCPSYSLTAAPLKFFFINSMQIPLTKLCIHIFKSCN